MTAAPINGIIFDYGQVLCFHPSDEQFLRMANVFRINLAEFTSLYDKQRLAYDRGSLTPEEYWFSVAKESGIHLSANQLLRLRAWDVEMWSNLNQPMLEWLEAVHRSGIRTALLSNMPVDHVVIIRRDFDWLRHIDFAVFSHEMQWVKPEARIYEYCLEGLGTLPQETLFVDDREVNVKAAQALGIHAIRFESTAQLRSELGKLHFPILPAEPALQQARHDFDHQRP